jgi:hypothetical protein
MQDAECRIHKSGTEYSNTGMMEGLKQKAQDPSQMMVNRRPPQTDSYLTFRLWSAYVHLIDDDVYQEVKQMDLGSLKRTRPLGHRTVSVGRRKAV